MPIKIEHVWKEDAETLVLVSTVKATCETVVDKTMFHSAMVEDLKLQIVQNSDARIRRMLVDDHVEEIARLRLRVGGSMTMSGFEGLEALNRLVELAMSSVSFESNVQ